MEVEDPDILHFPLMLSIKITFAQSGNKFPPWQDVGESGSCK